MPIRVELALEFLCVGLDFPLILVLHVLYGLIVGHLDELHLILQSFYFFLEPYMILLAAVWLAFNRLDVLLELLLAEGAPFSSRLLYRSA